MAFNLEIVLLVSAILLLASLIHGSIGFGFPMVATPLLAITLDIQTAILLTLVPTLLVNLVSIVSEGNLLTALRRHYALALLAMLGSGIGTEILISTDTEIFKIFLAAAIIVYLIVGQVKFKISWIGRYPKASKIIFGIGAGILGGLTNVMGPVLIIYSLEAQYDKKDLIQASNICFMFGKTIQLILFMTSATVITDELSLSALMLVVISLGLYLGVKVKQRINEVLYRSLLKGLLLILAAVLTLQTLL